MNSVTQISLKLLIPVLASVVAITPLAIDMYLPAMPTLADFFAVSQGKIQLSLSLYLLFFALGALVFGPIADRYGRRPLILFGLTGFVISSVALALVDNVQSFLMFRALQAFTGVAASVTIPGIIRQRFGKNTAKGLSYVSMVMMIAPMLAPAVGTALMAVADWRMIFWALAAYGLLTLVLGYFFIIDSKPETQQQGFNLKALYWDKYKKVLGHKPARMQLMSSMFASFAFFCYLTAISFVYIDFFGVSEFVFSILFGINVVALVGGNFINTRLVPKIGSQRMLLRALSVATMSVVSLLIVLQLNLSVYWAALSIIPLLAGLSLTAVNADALTLIEFKEESGTATAVLSTLKFTAGALAGPVLALYSDTTAMPFATLMAFGVGCVITCQLISYLGRKRESELAIAS